MKVPDTIRGVPMPLVATWAAIPFVGLFVISLKHSHIAGVIPAFITGVYATYAVVGAALAMKNVVWPAIKRDLKVIA